MKAPELLLPAGSLDKMRAAYDFGADAVYAGQPRYWLRALPGLLRGRRNRWITPDNGYISHNAHRLEFNFDDQFVVDGEFFSTEPGCPLVLTDGGRLDFLTAHRR